MLINPIKMEGIRSGVNRWVLDQYLTNGYVSINIDDYAVYLHPERLEKDQFIETPIGKMRVIHHPFMHPDQAYIINTKVMFDGLIPKPKIWGQENREKAQKLADKYTNESPLSFGWPPLSLFDNATHEQLKDQNNSLKLNNLGLERLAFSLEALVGARVEILLKEFRDKRQIGSGTFTKRVHPGLDRTEYYYNEELIIIVKSTIDSGELSYKIIAVFNGETG